MLISVMLIKKISVQNRCESKKHVLRRERAGGGLGLNFEFLKWSTSFSNWLKWLYRYLKQTSEHDKMDYGIHGHLGTPKGGGTAHTGGGGHREGTRSDANFHKIFTQKYGIFYPIFVHFPENFPIFQKNLYWQGGGIPPPPPLKIFFTGGD